MPVNDNLLYKRFKPSSDAGLTSSRFMAWSHQFFANPSPRSCFILRNETAGIHFKMAQAFAGRFEFTLITAPRGYAKTTWCRLWVLYCACYEMEPSILFVSKPGQGSENGRFVRNQLAINSKLIEVYGNLLPSTNKAKKDTAKSKDNDNLLTLTNGVTIGFTTIEGNTHGTSGLFRPTLIICEDLQAEKHMTETATLIKHYKLFENDVVFAKDEEFGKIIVIGNNYGKGSVVGNIIAEVESDKRLKAVPKWHVLNMDDLFDDNGLSVWEDRFPTKKLKAKAEMYARQGKIAIWNAQMRNMPDEGQTKSITGYKFHDCHVEMINGYNYLISKEYPFPLRCHLVLAIDPAFSDSKSSDNRAKVLLAKAKFPFTDTEMAEGTFIIEYEYDKSDPSNIPRWITDMHSKWTVHDMVIEANGGQIIFKYLNEKEFKDNKDFKRNAFASHYITYIKESKGDRIWNSLSLQCKYGQFFIKQNHYELIEELDNFGYHIRSSGIHLLDAIQMADAETVSPEPDRAATTAVFTFPKRNESSMSNRAQLKQKLARARKSYLLW
jgi:hypothetical protein